MPKATLWDYILSPIHPIGRFKYRLFLSIGYATDDWEIFEVDLLHPAASTEAVAETYEPDGLEVEFVTASGRTTNLLASQ